MTRGEGEKKVIRAKVRGGDDDVELAFIYFILVIIR